MVYTIYQTWVYLLILCVEIRENSFSSRTRKTMAAASDTHSPSCNNIINPQTEGQIERERQTYEERQTYKKTDIQRDRQTERLTDRETDRERDRHTEKGIKRYGHTDRQTFIETDIAEKRADRETDRHTGRQKLNRNHREASRLLCLPLS